MSYYITVITDTGNIADWYIPRLRVNQLIPLKPQATRRLPGSAGGAGPGVPGAGEVNAVRQWRSESVGWRPFTDSLNSAEGLTCPWRSLAARWLP